MDGVLGEGEGAGEEYFGGHRGLRGYLSCHRGAYITRLSTSK